MINKSLSSPLSFYLHASIRVSLKSIWRENQTLQQKLFLQKSSLLKMKRLIQLQWRLIQKLMLSIPSIAYVLLSHQLRAFKPLICSHPVSIEYIQQMPILYQVLGRTQKHRVEKSMPIPKPPQQALPSQLGRKPNIFHYLPFLYPSIEVNAILNNYRNFASYSPSIQSWRGGENIWG